MNGARDASSERALWTGALADLHPLLLALYPPLALLARNLGDVAWADAWRAMAAALVLGVVLVIAGRLVTRDAVRGALWADGMLLLFFSYGHTYNLIEGQTVAGFVVGRHRYLLLLWALLGAAATWILTRQRAVQPTWCRFMSVVVLALVAMPGYVLLRTAASSVAMQAESMGAEASPAVDPETLPDIYYIVLDGYGRADVLQDLYGYDNTPFLRFLEDQGFYVARDSHSNYVVTLLSLASSLNMRYVNDLADLPIPDHAIARTLSLMIRHSALREALAARGYQIIAFESGYLRTHIYDADLYLSPPPLEAGGLRFNRFEALLLDTTVFAAPLDLLQREQGERLRQIVVDPEYEAHRRRILFTLEKLPEVAEMPGAYFVFAHIVAPHPPFVFGPNGERMPQAGPMTMADGSHFQGTREAYIAGYVGQLTYLNRRLEEVILAILESSRVPPVIVLQADHGPGAYLVWEDREQTDLRERTSILTAVYVARDTCRQSLYPSLAPVNTFRVLLDCLFEAGLDRLPDWIYFSTTMRLLDFVDVTFEVSHD